MKDFIFKLKNIENKKFYASFFAIMLVTVSSILILGSNKTYSTSEASKKDVPREGLPGCYQCFGNPYVSDGWVYVELGLKDVKGCTYYPGLNRSECTSSKGKAGCYYCSGSYTQSDGYVWSDVGLKDDVNCRYTGKPQSQCNEDLPGGGDNPGGGGDTGGGGTPSGGNPTINACPAAGENALSGTIQMRSNKAWSGEIKWNATPNGDGTYTVNAETYNRKTDGQATGTNNNDFKGYLSIGNDKTEIAYKEVHPKSELIASLCGVIVSENEVKIESSVTKDAKTGTTLAGQTLSGSSIVKLKEDKPVEPENTKKEVNVTFKVDGKVVDTKSCTYDTKTQSNCTVIAPSGVKENKIFNGWSENTNCNNSLIKEGNTIVLTGDKELKACFSDKPSNPNPEPENTKKEVKVTFKVDGKVVDTKSCTYDTKTQSNCTVIAPKGVKENMVFNGWSENTNCNTSLIKEGNTIILIDNKELNGCFSKKEEQPDPEVKPEETTYNIEYDIKDGIFTGAPNSGEKDQTITIPFPSKEIKLIINNKNAVVIGNYEEKVILPFEGWTSKNVELSTAMAGDKLWKDVILENNKPIYESNFKNLAKPGNTVNLVANYGKKEITLPTLSKEGYTCYFNKNGNGSDKNNIKSGDKLTVDNSSNASINLYTVCYANDKTDEEIDSNNQTGTAFIVLTWLIGLSTLGFSAYYLKTRKMDF